MQVQGMGEGLGSALQLLWIGVWLWSDSSRIVKLP